MWKKNNCHVYLSMLIGIGLLLFQGCVPSGATYQIGLSTDTITANIKATEQGEALKNSLAVVYYYHHTFVQHPFPTGTPFGEVSSSSSFTNLQRVSAAVKMPNQSGHLQIHIPMDVVAVEVWFIAEERTTQFFRFTKQLGVGGMKYHTALPKEEKWRDHYLFFLSPRLEALITDSRYGLSPQGQVVLSGWLQQQQTKVL